MDIVITIQEVKPGFMTTKIRAGGLATNLEREMTKHLAECINRGLEEFDKKPGMTGGGSGLKMIERKIPKG